MQNFTKFNLSEPLLAAISKLGFEEPTPIQDQTISLALEGKDLIGQAPTGTGKTAAFGLPMIENIDKASSFIQGLVVTPTRELAVQVSEELFKLGQTKGVFALPIYGGQDIGKQINALKRKPHIIVGTPGRIMDHMRRKTIRFQELKTVVLDEADEMLNMGFLDDIKFILEQVPTERQTLLFSATMPREIQLLAQQFMREPTLIKVALKGVSISPTVQYYLEVNESKKFDVLCNLLDIHIPQSAIIFGRTKRRVDELNEALNKRGYSADGIHGDLTQAKRDSVMNQFRQGIVDILVATDVAARGLDISGVTHVYNFDIPQDPEGYIHRIGRTGRAGRTGEAFTLITPREMPQLRIIEQLTKGRILRHPVPGLTDALVGLQKASVERLLQTCKEPTSAKYRNLAESLLDQQDSITLISSALRLLTKEPNTTPVNLTEEKPVFSKNRAPRSQEKSHFRGPKPKPMPQKRTSRKAKFHENRNR